MGRPDRQECPMSTIRPHLPIIDALNLIRRLHAVQAQQALTPAPVSYTHLTLPTILLV